MLELVVSVLVWSNRRAQRSTRVRSSAASEVYKSQLRDLVTVIPDPAERINHTRSASLSNRFAFATVATVACALIFALTLAHVRSDRALYSVALKWQETVLQAVVS